MKYTPDTWVFVRIISPQNGEVNKIMAGWYGGYAGSDEWRLSSGNVSERHEGDFIVYGQDSGSEYWCHKNTQKMSGLMHSVFNSYEDEIAKLGENSGISMKVIPVVFDDSASV